MSGARPDRMARVLKGMELAGLDALIAASQDNFFYVSGAKIQMQLLIRHRLALTVTGGDGKTTLVVATPEEHQARRNSWVEDVRPYSYFAQSPMEIVADTLKERGLAGARIGVEKKYLPAASYEDLQARLPGATLLPGDVVFEWARPVKTAEEIDSLRLAARGTDEAISRALRAARCGDPEHRLARIMCDELFNIGNGEFRDTTWGVASGPNTLGSHYWAGERELGPGEIIRINLRSAIRGYFSHLYRMAVVGEPNERQRSWYQRSRDMHLRAIDRLRPGARLCDLYDAARKEAEDADIELYCSHYCSHIGHSTGITIHEHPYIRPGDETIVEPGMVFAVEPMFRDPGYSIYHLEDLVLVTERDPVLLSDCTNTESLFVVQ